MLNHNHIIQTHVNHELTVFSKRARVRGHLIAGSDQVFSGYFQRVYFRLPRKSFVKNSQWWTRSRGQVKC